MTPSDSPAPPGECDPLQRRTTTKKRKIMSSSISSPSDDTTERQRLCECGRKTPAFSERGDKTARWCHHCPTISATAVRTNSMCECKNAQPRFAEPGAARAVWCSNCPNRTVTAVSLERKCACGASKPNFGEPGSKKAQWCSTCPKKSATAINLYTKLCECGSAQPYFNEIGETKPRWCLSCPNKSSTAVSNYNRKCECGQSQPSYGIPGKSTTKWCSKCPTKPTTARNIVDKRCECGGAIARFNEPGHFVGRWCSTCPTRSLTAVNVKNKLCECGSALPSLNEPGLKKRRWCVNCPEKSDTAISLLRNLCECGAASAQFNEPGEKRGRWCANCPTRSTTSINIMAPRCEVCFKTAIYGYLFKSFSRCSPHKLPNMYSKPTARCEGVGCKQRPLYTDQVNHYPLRCETHKRSRDENVVERPCTNCHLTYYLRDGLLCDPCRGFLGEPPQKRKEMAVAKMLDAWNVVYKDQMYISGRYTDFWIECSGWVIVLEVDENQHRGQGYDCSCEQGRMLQIFNDPRFIDRRVIFIRYNPDNFRDSNQRLVKPTSKREEKLKQVVEWYQRNQPQFPCSVLYLNYDGDNGVSSVYEVNTGTLQRCLTIEEGRDHE